MDDGRQENDADERKNRPPGVGQLWAEVVKTLCLVMCIQAKAPRAAEKKHPFDTYCIHFIHSLPFLCVFLFPSYDTTIEFADGKDVAPHSSCLGRVIRANKQQQQQQQKRGKTPFQPVAET